MLWNIFMFCIGLGIALPLLSLLTGWFGGLFGGISLDTDVSLDVDVGLDMDMDVDFSGPTQVSAGGIVPSFNVMCFCLFLIVFGATGQALLPSMTNPLTTGLFLGVAFVLGALFYWLLYHFLIKRLKESNASVFSYQDLKGKTAEVTLAMSGNSMGTISMRDSTGAAISFRAKIDPDLLEVMPDKLERGERVVITEADAEKKICYVGVSIGEIMKHKLGEVN